MKVLYLNFEGEEDHQVDEQAGLNKNNPSRIRDRALGSRAGEEEVVVEEVTE